MICSDSKNGEFGFGFQDLVKIGGFGKNSEGLLCADLN